MPAPDKELPEFPDTLLSFKVVFVHTIRNQYRDYFGHAGITNLAAKNGGFDGGS